MRFRQRPKYPSLRVIQTELVLILVIGENLGVAAPVGDGPERFTRKILAHVILQLIAETARLRFVGRPLIQDAADSRVPPAKRRNASVTAALTTLRLLT